MKQCPYCKTLHSDDMHFCPQCGAALVNTPANGTTPPPYGYQYPAYNNDAFAPSGPSGKCRGVAALLAIFLGQLGIQYFYLGKVGGGLLSILLSVCTCGIWGLVSLVQGVYMLCMTNEDFENKYVRNPSAFPLF
ncbi:MAG: NINE protein [Muribaculaceae bacterium]|nr:NINE protein [Muribaculaceae bacterium]